MIKKYFKKQKQSPEHKMIKKESGFTIIEMIVTIGIFSILTAITLFNYGDFNNSIILTNLSYEVALEVRQAQVYSLGVRSSALGESSREDFNTRFGIYMNLGKDQGTKNITFFADADSDGVCDYDGDSCAVATCVADADNECRQVLSLSHSAYFEDICIAYGGFEDLVDTDINVCKSGASVINDEVYQVGNGDVSVTFQRPNPDSIVNDYTNLNMAIILATPAGQKRAVIINNTGQISVEFLTD
jgi:prepilin-type N-terminal cleavage/methylation domain-containing protein